MFAIACDYHAILASIAFRFSEVAANSSNISYSDSEYEYRHVQLPKAMLKAIPKDYHDPSKGTLKLLWEDEWRALGITQVRPVATTTYHVEVARANIHVL